MTRDRFRMQGFTLTELLIVVAIVVLLLLFALINLKTQISRGHDTQRKADLSKLQKSFEEYFNDRECYPSGEIVNNCLSTDLTPYLHAVPCDPVMKTPYLYVPGEPSACSGYRLCTKLEDETDADIERIGCHPTNGCGFGPEYNYCVSAGVSAIAEGFVAYPTPTSSGGGGGAGSGNTPTPTSGGGGAGSGNTPTPTPANTPTPTTNPYGGPFACTAGGACNYTDNPQAHGCPLSWATTCPPGACANSANRCAD